jgi:drug/metabolite transporter (DMT)-like permease
MSGSTRPGAFGAGVALVALSGASFGALAIFARIAYAHGADPLTVLTVRFVIAGACMVLVMRVGGHRFPRGRTLVALALLGGVGYVVESLAYFYALTVASAALVALLLYLYPAIVTVLAALVYKQRLTRLKITALVVALAGTALTIGELGGGRPLGIVLGVAAAVSYAVYILLSSRVGPRAGAIPAATVIMLAAAVSLGTATAIRGPSFPTAPAGWIAIVALALISTVVAIVAFFAGLERIGPAEASTVSTVEPVVTVALAAAVLGESITVVQVVGGTLILVAVVILAQAGRVVPETTPPA